MIDLSTFWFEPSNLSLDSTVDLIARVPPGLNNRKALFQVLQQELYFPAYFGYNWDALSECLRDLSWIKSRRVVILHTDIPALGTKDTSLYLEILTECVRNWKPQEDHELLVVFPPRTQETIAAVLSKNPS